MVSIPFLYFYYIKGANLSVGWEFLSSSIGQDKQSNHLLKIIIEWRFIIVKRDPKDICFFGFFLSIYEVVLDGFMTSLRTLVA
jgi:hypothetical protein